MRALKRYTLHTAVNGHFGIRLPATSIPRGIGFSEDYRSLYVWVEEPVGPASKGVADDLPAQAVYEFVTVATGAPFDGGGWAYLDLAVWPQMETAWAVYWRARDVG